MSTSRTLDLPPDTIEPRPAGPSTAPPPRPRRRTWRYALRRDWQLYSLAILPLAFFLIFRYLPMLGNVIAWQNYSPYSGFINSTWAGWSNFERVFSNPLFLNAVGNTLTITAFQLVFFFPVPILLALLGGIPGLVFAALATMALRSSLANVAPAFAVSPDIVLLGIGLMIALGVITGIIPALNAMRLKIAAALGRG